MSWAEREDRFNERFRSGRLADPLVFHPEEWPQIPEAAAEISVAVDGSALQGVFAMAALDIDEVSGVEVVTRTPNVEIRIADFDERPRQNQQWTINGKLWKSTKREPVGEGWDRHHLQRAAPPSQEP